MGKKHAVAAFVVVSAVASVAQGIPFDPYGSKSWRTPPEKPRVVPSTQCFVAVYAAYANPTDQSLDAYMFSGTCTVNVAPEGKPPVMQKVKVQIEAEWSPSLKRASEIVRIFHPDKNFQFTTWATCDKDPFLMGSPATCKDQGMGGPDFSLYIRREDAPLAKSRVSLASLPAMTSRVTSRQQIRNVGTIKSMELTTASEISVGQQAAVKTTFGGGPGACPMEIDFGDGYVQWATSSEDLTYDLAAHPYTKAGSYTITARPFPGCTGTASVKINVKPASVEAIGGRPGIEWSRMGQPAGIIVSGRSGSCKATVDFGDGTTEPLNTAFAPEGGKVYIEHVYREPGSKTLKVTGIDGCLGSATGTFNVVPTAVKMVKNLGAVPPFQIVSVIAGPGFCPLRVDWGDGVVEEIKDAEFPNSTLQLQHRPKKSGKLLVSVRGIDGCVGVAGAWLNVP